MKRIKALRKYLLHKYRFGMKLQRNENPYKGSLKMIIICNKTACDRIDWQASFQIIDQQFFHRYTCHIFLHLFASLASKSKPLLFSNMPLKHFHIDAAILNFLNDFYTSGIICVFRRFQNLVIGRSNLLKLNSAKHFNKCRSNRNHLSLTIKPS